VIAMLLAAFAAVVAASVLADQERWTRSVTYRRDQVQAQATAIAGIQWARQILFDARHNAIDHLGQPWAVRLPPIPLDNGEIRGSIVDAQSRLNVNALGDDTAVVERTRLTRLFAQTGGPIGAIDAIADWIDADSRPRSQGAEDAWYAAQNPPRIVANAPVLRIAEIASVRGVTGEALAAVRPFVTALPLPRPALNVNTAPAEVIATVLDNAPPDAVAAVLAARAQRPFASIADFRSRLPQGVRIADESMLDVKSTYFEVTVEARQGTSVARARALLHRDAEHWPAVVWQVIE